MLLNESGKPLIQHTYEAAARATLADDILVAADDPLIVQAVEAFAGHAVLTSPHHPSGTDRLAEVAQHHPDVQLFINVQGDEPEIEAEDIDLAIRLLVDHPAAHMSTLATPISDQDQVQDPACVKVVFDQSHRALYFSRSPIPHAQQGFHAAIQNCPDGLYYQHVGMYVYRRETLLELTAADRSANEITESLEQLRALHLGKTILVGVTSRPSRGIDTAEDYRAFVSRNSS